MKRKPIIHLFPIILLCSILAPSHAHATELTNKIDKLIGTYSINSKCRDDSGPFTLTIGKSATMKFRADGSLISIEKHPIIYSHIVPSDHLNDFIEWTTGTVRAGGQIKTNTGTYDYTDCDFLSQTVRWIEEGKKEKIKSLYNLFESYGTDQAALTSGMRCIGRALGDVQMSNENFKNWMMDMSGGGGSGQFTYVSGPIELKFITPGFKLVDAKAPFSSYLNASLAALTKDRSVRLAINNIDQTVMFINYVASRVSPEDESPDREKLAAAWMSDLVRKNHFEEFRGVVNCFYRDRF